MAIPDSMPRTLFRAIPCLLLAASSAAGGVRDPAFAEIPFERWLKEGNTSPLKWKARVSPPELHFNQRLAGQLELEFDGADLEPRRGKGEIRVFVQAEDSSGEVYQDHGVIDLKPLKEGFRKFTLTYTQPFFFTPGRYTFSVLVEHSAAAEHWSRSFTVAVAPLNPDPLPGVWKDLPSIEMAPPMQTPESYWIPALKGALRAPAQSPGPLEVDVLLNLSPSPREAGKLHIQERNLEVLLPALRAITELLPRGARINVDLLDLVRHRVAFRLRDGRPLQFADMRNALRTEPGKIDLRTLAHRDEQAGYFVAEVAKHLAPSRVVIVLSALVELDPGDARRRIEADLPPSAKVFYLCYTPAAPPPFEPSMPGRTSRRRETVPARAPFLPVDMLARTLQPLDPVVFHFASPMQLRKAIAAMLREISQER